MKDAIKVSVICVTYNQEEYIEQTLRGFASQKTNFKIEVIVADDCSTDQTPKIVAKFARDYPEIFKPVLRKKNLGIIGNNIDSLRQAKGQYVALCEGDDYWTDPLKLQKQADLLDKHPDMALCFHPVEVMFEGEGHKNHIYPEPGAFPRFDTEQLLKVNFIQTNAVMYRRQNYDNIPIDIMPLDWYLHLYHAQFGKIGFIDEAMSVYRRHPGGVWWNQRTQPEKIWIRHGYGFIRLLHEIMLMYGDNAKNRKIINNHIAGSYEIISSIKPQSAADDVAIRSISGTPSETWDYIRHLMQQVNNHVEREVQLQEMVESEISAKKQLAGELQDMQSSKLWRALLIVRFALYAAKHPIGGAKRVAQRVHGKRSKNEE